MTNWKKHNITLQPNQIDLSQVSFPRAMIQTNQKKEFSFVSDCYISAYEKNEYGIFQKNKVKIAKLFNKEPFFHHKWYFWMLWYRAILRKCSDAFLLVRSQHMQEWS